MLVDAADFAGDSTIHLSVVSPVYGCKGCLRELVDQVAVSVVTVTGDFELILVDDASPDGAWAVIEELAAEYPWVRGFQLSRNFGQHAAIYAGLCQTRGEWIVVMDCDLQDVPSAIPDLYSAALSEHADVVLAKRMDRQDSRLKRLQSRGFYWTLQWLTGVPQDPTVANFGLYHRKVIATVLHMPEQERAFQLMVKWTGFRQIARTVEHAPRFEGSSSYTISKLVRLASGIALSYSDKPLRMVAGGGIACSLVAFTLTLVAIISLITGQTTVAGYTSIIASIWLLGGLTLLSLGVVGLYVGQVFRNVQGRPTAVITRATAGGGAATPRVHPKDVASD